MKCSKQVPDPLWYLQSDVPSGTTVEPHPERSCSLNEEHTNALLDVRDKRFALSLLKNKCSCKDHMQGQWLKHCLLAPRGASEA